MRKWLFAMPAVSLPWYLYAGSKTHKMSEELHDKYMKDLSDFDLDTFDAMYENANRKK